MNEYYVYGHYRKDTDLLFYVGKGKKNRFRDSKNRNRHWTHIAEKHGFTVFFFCRDMDEDSAYALEKAITTDLSPEANYATGGKWGGFKGRKHSEERNRKLSERHKGKIFRPVTDQDLARLAASAKKKSKPIINLLTGERYDSIRNAARKTGLSKSWIIWNLKKGKRFAFQ